MASAPSTPGSTRRNNINTDYRFYDENYKPMWNRGISRKIGESAFVQQTLPTFRLSWSPYTVCPCFLLMGALFTGMGVGIKKFSDGIQEVNIPYTNCMSLEYPERTCADVISQPGIQDAIDIENCTCRVNFNLKEPINGTIYMYYTLTDFFQNHKHHYLSRDDNQLKGNLFDKKGKAKSPSSACEPLDRDNDTKKIVYPCGLMANTMFTDVIDLFYHPENDMFFGIDSIINKYEHETENRRAVDMKVPLKNTGIAWESDKDEKYVQPKDFNDTENPKWDNFVKPRAWKKTLWQLDPHNDSNNGVENEDFIVWMRTAAFPWFRKLYRIIDSNFAPFDKGLPQGNYSLRIIYNYDVSSFKGEKQILLTTSSMVAAKNMFLAIVYMGTGALCIFLSIFLFIAYKCSRHTVEKSFKND